MDKKKDFASSIKELEQINAWFQQEDIDLDEGLAKLKEGQKLIANCRKRLRDVENEFVKIKADIEKESESDKTETETVAEKDNENDGIPF
jgi:exodeoxyribonuclease VII small subunit